MLGKFGSQLRNQWMGAVALFLVLSGGTAYAVTQIDNNSVRSKHIVNGQVKSGDVRDDGLTGADIREETLGQVPSAAAADAAQDADTLDGQDSDAFQAAGVIHRSGYKTLPVPVDTSTPANTQVLRAGPFEFTGICEFAGQESYARMRITTEDQGYFSSDADNGTTLIEPLTLDNATIPVGGGNAEAGVTRAFTLLSLESNDVFQGELFYAIVEQYNLCYYSVSGTLN